MNLADTSDRSCQSENVANNFVLYHPPTDTRERLTTRTPFANTLDASFLLACANHRHSYRKSSDLIAVVNARLPMTPVGLTEAPYVGDPMVRLSFALCLCKSTKPSTRSHLTSCGCHVRCHHFCLGPV